MTRRACPVARRALPVGGCAFLFRARLPARREFSAGLMGTAPRYTGGRPHDCLTWLISVCHLEMSERKGFIHIWSGLHEVPFYSFIFQQWIM